MYTIRPTKYVCTGFYQEKHLYYRGTKNTLWEGGVHGVGFIHSQLLKKPRVKTNNLVHVSDWLPTLYSAAGGRVHDLGTIDGQDLWDMLRNDGPSLRKEVLHNIDPVSKFFAIRVGDYKLIQGDILKHRNDDWYPCNPPSKNANSTASQCDIIVTVNHTNTHINKRNSDTPFVINCGPKGNSTSKCNPYKHPCLFHLPSDPCEYHDLADTYPSIVKDLLGRVQAYAAGAVTPVNKPSDPFADPALHEGVWSPWQDA